MRLIQPDAEILFQENGRKGMLEHIERVAKTCYKSTPQGGEEAEEFVKRLIGLKHTAMLEHGTVYLTIPRRGSQKEQSFVGFFDKDPYSYCAFTQEDAFITTNYRVIIESAFGKELDKYILDEPTSFHALRYTARIITDRGVSHELVRHKKLCVA